MSKILYQCPTVSSQQRNVSSMPPFVMKSQVTKILRNIGFAMLLLVYGSAHANADVYQRTVRLKERNSGLEKIFNQIRKQTGYNFLYNDRILKNTTLVSINTDGQAPLNTVLDELFKNQPLTYSIIDKTIIVKAKKETAASVVSPPPLEHLQSHRLTFESVQAKMRHVQPIEKPDLLLVLKGNVTDEKGEVLPGVRTLLQRA